MSYMNLDSLKRYAQKEKEWSDKKFLSENDLNWQKTEKTSIVYCYPINEFPLEPIVDFTFTEILPTEGNKAPDNPSTITGVSSVKVTRRGKNLLPLRSNGSEVKNEVTFVIANGIYTVTGTGGTNNSSLYISNKNVPVFQGTTYFVSGCPSGGSNSTYKISLSFYPNDGSSVSYFGETGSGTSFTPNKDGTLTVAITVYAGYEVSGLVFKPQIEKGSSATAFESPTSTDYTIQFGDTYYGGSLDVASSTMTVTHRGIIFNGTEDWQFNSNTPNSSFKVYHIRITDNPGNTIYSQESCTHFPVSETLYTGTPIIRGTRTYVYIEGDFASKTDLTDWITSQYNNGTPVVFVYELETPQIIQLSPTQILSLPLLDKCTPRVNTLYTDAESIQVGYAKHPSRTAYELQQAIIAGGSH